MIKSILGGKSKNLFDISKVVQSANLKNNGNGTLTVSGYGISAGILRDLCPNIKVGDTIKAYYTPISWTAPNPPRVIMISGHIMDRVANPSFVVTEADLNGNVYFYNNNYPERNLPGTTVIGNIFITNDTSVTAANYKDRYVPYELTSYKSIMKVRDVCQLVDKSKFTTSGTRNGITWVSNGDGSITLNGTCTNGFALNPSNQHIPVDQTHFYYASPYLSINYSGRIDGTYETGGIVHIKTPAWPIKFNTVFYIWIDKDKSFSNVTTFINIDDLTEMFGAGNEPKTVAEFKAKFPNDYYPYSPSCFVTSYDERMPCKTKNLFSSSTEVGIPSSTEFDMSEKRLLEDGKWYIGLTGSNYYSRDSVLDYSIMENSVYIKWKNNGYAVAKCIYCEPNTTYSFTEKYSLIQGESLGIYVGFYTEDGTFISFKGETASPRFVFTTPEKCKYVAICITGTKFPNDNFGAGCFSDLQLVKGTIATDYVPYGYV